MILQLISEAADWQTVAAALSTELAAERQHHIRTVKACDGINADLTKLLEAEREHNESTIVELEQQLVAEREKNNLLMRAATQAEATEQEKIKLLVDALEQIRSMYGDRAVGRICADALAKVEAYQL